MNKKISFFILIIFSLVFVGAGCQKDQANRTKATLVFWGVFDDSDIIDLLLKDFKTVYPNVTIEYRKKTIEDYEKDLVNALAEGRGPDVFMIHSTWLPKHEPKLSPAPAELITLKEYQDSFVDVAKENFVNTNGIYSLPLYVDTLALFYNKDIFNNAGIATPPATWEEFQQTVMKLTKVDQFGNISEAGAAIGTAKNINRSPDILYNIILQNGSNMISEEGEVDFNDFAGQDALRFYTDFANQTKKVYTWNPLQHYSIDAFTERQAAMMFNYAYQYNTLKAKNPRFNFAVAPMPQIKKTDLKVNYANYWSPAVSKASENGNIAWEFLKFISSKEEAEKYLAAAKRPAARRDIIETQKTDADLGVFAEQALSAKSWYQADNSAIDKIFADAIENVISGTSSVMGAMAQAAEKVNLLMKDKRKNTNNIQ